jgi:hypothetical protein
MKQKKKYITYKAIIYFGKIRRGIGVGESNSNWRLQEEQICL